MQSSITNDSSSLISFIATNQAVANEILCSFRSVNWGATTLQDSILVLELVIIATEV